MGNDAMDDMMAAMLDASQEREEESKRREEIQKTQDEELRRFRQAIAEQTTYLITILGTVIDEFNRLSTSGHIVVSRHGDKVLYSLPHQPEPLVLEFFTVSPALNLSTVNQGHVPLAAYLQGYNGTGRNFLWCQNSNNDFQGRWIACRVGTDALARPKLGRKPYGIVYGFDNADQLREIETSISVMHVYTVAFDDDVCQEFKQVMLSAMTTE